MQTVTPPLRRVVFDQFLLITIFLAACCTAAISEDKVSSFGSVFSEKLQLFAKDLKYEEMQSFYDDVGALTEDFDTEDQLNAMAESVSTRLDAKVHALNVIRKQIEDLALDRGALPTGTDTQCCEYDQRDEFSPLFKAEVDMYSTCIRVPEGYDGQSNLGDADIMDARDLSRPLTPTWIELYGNDTDLRWMYYGDESGLFRKYPMGYSSDCGAYDARFRPWYVAAITPLPKNVILIVDTSGSMGNGSPGFPNRMETAIDSAQTVLSTLGPNDYVYAFGFSNQLDIPFDCLGDAMVKATPENIDLYKDFVAGLTAGGTTLYDPTFEHAFNIHMDHTEISDNPTVIMFLTDGQATDTNLDLQSKFNDLADLYKENLYVFTYGFGNELAPAAEDLLIEIANYLPNPGLTEFIQDGEDLRTVLGKYYAFDAFQREDTSYDAVEIVWTVPYLDYSGLGLITTAAVPVYDRTDPQNPIPLGVTAMDTPLEELLQDISSFESETTYGFLIDNAGRTIIHPNLPAPQDYGTETDPVYLDISILETATNTAGYDVFGEDADGTVRRQMIQQSTGCSSDLTAVRAIPLGDAEYSGAIKKNIPTEYCWKAIAGTSFTLAIARNIDFGQKVTADPDDSDGLAEFDYYHRLDLYDEYDVEHDGPGFLCDQLGSPSTKDHSVYMSAPKGYEDMFSYSLLEEDVDRLLKISQFVERRGSYVGFQNIWKEGILEDVLVTSLIEEDWIDSLTDDLADYVIWRYIGTQNGVFRTYPGHQMSQLYDATVRPWFFRSLAYPGDIVLSAPYEAASSVGTVITLSVSIEDQRNEGITAVMGMDFTVGKFLSILDGVTGTDCDGVQTKCMLMDTSGFLVLHPDFLTSRNNGLCNPFEHGNIFIGQCEPSLARELISLDFLSENACNNFEDRKNQKFWKVADDAFDSSWSGSFQSESSECSHSISNFYVAPIEETNLILIAYDHADEASFCESDCDCSSNSCPNEECHCVCQEDIDYDTCTATFGDETADQPICPLAPPDAGKVDLSMGYDDVNWGESCFEHSCMGKSEGECTSLGCIWCVLARNSEGSYEALDAPQCVEGSSLDDCPNTNENSSQHFSMVSAWILMTLGAIVLCN